jgi:hypothetical protein
MKRLTLFAAVSVLASVPATMAAIALYMVLVLHERPAQILLPDVVFFGFAPSIRGALLAAVTGALLSVFRTHIGRWQFVVLSIVMAGIAGYLLGLWVVGDSPHLSARIAAMLLAATWSIMAVIVASVSVRKTI